MLCAPGKLPPPWSCSFPTYVGGPWTSPQAHLPPGSSPLSSGAAGVQLCRARCTGLWSLQTHYLYFRPCAPRVAGRDPGRGWSGPLPPGRAGLWEGQTAGTPRRRLRRPALEPDTRGTGPQPVRFPAVQPGLSSLSGGTWCPQLSAGTIVLAPPSGLRSPSSARVLGQCGGAAEPSLYN